jgi:hypothetical protein
MQFDWQAEQVPSFRFDVPLHDLLTKPIASSPVGSQPVCQSQRFPEPVFSPQHPELSNSANLDGDWTPPETRTHCFSRLNPILGWCYNDQRVIQYFLKQLAHGFQGIKGQLYAMSLPSKDF